jgi:hypothetical protein
MTPDQLTPAQNEAVQAKFDQNPDGCETIAELYDRIQPELMSNGAVLINQWCGMVVGIETDGYTHT